MGRQRAIRRAPARGGARCHRKPADAPGHGCEGDGDSRALVDAPSDPARLIGGLLTRELAYSWAAAKRRWCVARRGRAPTADLSPTGARRPAHAGGRGGGARRNGRAELSHGQAWICTRGGELARRCDRRGHPPSVPRHSSSRAAWITPRTACEPSRTHGLGWEPGRGARSQATADHTDRDRAGLLQTRA